MQHLTHAEHTANLKRILAELQAAKDAMANDGYIDSDEFLEAQDEYEPDALRLAIDHLDDFIYETTHD